jgi:predicted acylesterase/phospholipase RssA
MILSILMTHINRGRDKKEPWQEFDMIGGTSTGGLLAIMLGRLRMSVRDCEKSYAELSEAIFAPRRNPANIVGRGIDFLKANGRFDESPLEKSIKEKVVGAGMDEEELLEDFRPDACKVSVYSCLSIEHERSLMLTFASSFVCATQVADSSPTLIRSYENPEVFGDLIGVKIWEAARATSAASTFFDPIQIGDHREKFADGALRHNNPISQVYQEAKDLWPDDDFLLLSIGTGSAPGQSINEGLRSLVEQLVKIATETGETARLFYRNHLEMVSANMLFRFNVYHGLGTIGLDESKEIHQIASRTRTYINEPEVVRKAKRCVIAFKDAAYYESSRGT